MGREQGSGGTEGGAGVAERREANERTLPGEAESVRGGMPSPVEIQYRLLVERVHEYAIFLMDADGVITHWGEGARRMKEFAPEEVLGRHLGMLYPPGGAEDGTAEEHLRHAREHGEYIGEGMRRARDRGLFPARVTLTALRQNGELYGFSKVTQDLSERRRIEERLEQALREAEAASVEKSRFLATMSHEIRTPINAVLGYADLLDLEIPGPLTPGQRGYLDRVRASGRHLLALIEDVLDFARVEAGRLLVRPERIRAAAVVDDALALVRPQAGARGLRVEPACGAETEAWGDPVRIRQVLVNLLGNAVKFTAPGGVVRVGCGSGEPGAAAALSGGGPWTFIRVEDTGIGIPPDRLAAVFEPFVQVEDAFTREHPGTGLGLAISRRLARLQCGDLTAESRPGEGSAFTLWLPATEAAAAGADVLPRGDPAATLTRIGAYLSGAAYGVVRAAADRLRVDPDTREHARHLTRSEIEDHTPTFLAEIAQVMVVLEEDGSDAEGILRDGAEYRTLMSRRHGQQRRRLGFTERALAREYEILHEEVESALRQANLAGTEGPAAESREMVRKLLARAAEHALRAHRGEPADD